MYSLRHLARVGHAIARPVIWAPIAIMAIGLISVAIGLAHVGAVWILLGTAILAVASLTAGAAAEPRAKKRSKIQKLWITVALLVSFIFAIGLYQRYLDPSRQQTIWYFAPNTEDETRCMHPSGEPGGPGLILGKGNKPLAPLCGGNSYAFSCQSVMQNGNVWIKLLNAPYWVPRMAFHSIAGQTVASLPACGKGAGAN
jgi:hypothetical protein